MRKETNLDVNLVATKNDRDAFADTLQVAVPVGNILVGDAGGDVEHDDTTLTLDVVAVTETSKLLLTSGIPNVEADGAKVGCKLEGVDLDTKSGYRARVRRLLHANRVLGPHRAQEAQI